MTPLAAIQDQFLRLLSPNESIDISLCVLLIQNATLSYSCMLHNDCCFFFHNRNYIRVYERHFVERRPDPLHGIRVLRDIKVCRHRPRALVFLVVGCLSLLSQGRAQGDGRDEDGQEDDEHGDGDQADFHVATLWKTGLFCEHDTLFSMLELKRCL